MTYAEMFENSAELHPKGGTRLSPAACGFILAEMDGLVTKYTATLTDPELSNTLRIMTDAHLIGLRAIRNAVKEGMSNKP